MKQIPLANCFNLKSLQDSTESDDRAQITNLCQKFPERCNNQFFSCATHYKHEQSLPSHLHYKQCYIILCITRSIGEDGWVLFSYRNYYCSLIINSVFHFNRATTTNQTLSKFIESPFTNSDQINRMTDNIPQNKKPIFHEPHLTSG